MIPRGKSVWLAAAVLLPLALIALSMSLALAGQAEFDVGVFKSDEPDPATAGESLSYTILVTNSSYGVTATNVLLTDTLPLGVEYVNDTDDCTLLPGTGPSGEDQLACDVTDLPPGGESSFSINVNVAPDAYDSYDPDICNTVEVSATTELGGGDANLANNSDEECTWIFEEADLTMEKWSHPGDVVSVGEWFSYTLWVENLGPSDSRYPIVFDWFATDGSMTVVAHEDGMCGPMPTDQDWAEAPAWLLSWLSAICEIDPELPVCYGDGFPWWAAWWYYWYYTFPPMYPYPLAVDWMCVWDLWDLPPGEQISRTVSVLPLDAQTIYNQAWAMPDVYPLIGIDGFLDEFEYYGTPDPDIFNNMDELVTQVTDEADLKVVKFSKPDEQVDAGLPFTYTIFVENLGPAYAQKVSIRDEMLSSGTFEIVDVLLDPNRENEGPIFLDSPEGGVTMEFHLHEPLEPKGPDNQGRWVIQIVAVAADTQDVNNLVQVFTREGGSSDPDLSNNEDEDSIAVGDVADLGIEKGWEEAPPEWFEGAPFGVEDCYLYDEFSNLYGVRAGCPLRFQIGVGNGGPSLAENVVVEDLIPAGVTVEGVGPSQGSCTTGIPGDPDAPLSCNLGNIPSGEGAAIEIFVMTRTDLAWEPLENDATVYSDIFDPDNGNNRSHVLIWVEPFSYLYLDKEGPPEIMAGEEIQYWINLRNDGPSMAHDVHLDDELPGGVSLLGADVMIGAGSCAPDSALCALGNMEPGDNRAVRVRGYVEPWLEPESVISNTVRAWANSPFFQPVPDEPISDTVETLVHSAADLSIRKTADPYKVYAGEQVRYDIAVTNNGPGMAYNVVVSDTLDPGVEFEISTADCEMVYSESVTPTMFGATQPNEGGGDLFSVDLSTGAGSFIGQMPDYLAPEIEYDNNSGRLFGSMGFSPWFWDWLFGYDYEMPRLYELDPETGGSLGDVTLDRLCALPGLEFVGDTLYGTCSDGPPWFWEGDPDLVTIDPDTGHVSYVGDTDLYEDALIHGLAYDESSDTMYGLIVQEYGPNALVTIDLNNGDSDWLCDIWDDDYSDYTYDLRAIEFGPDGTLYGGIAEDSDLVIIDPNPQPNNGNYCMMTHVGDTGFSVTGLSLAELRKPLGMVCHVGDIPPGETATFSIWARVEPDTLGIINNRVDLFSDSEDPNPDNNWDSEANLVLGKADLKVTKYGKPDGEVRAGEELEYWVVVDNLGPGYAHDVVIYDLISSDGEFELWWGDYNGDGEQYSCQVSGNCDCFDGWCECYQDASLTCRLNHPLPVMGPYSPGRWLLKVWVEAYEDQSINNLARVVSSDFDPDLSNNEAIAEHEITAVADLWLGKEAWGEILVGCEGETEPWEDQVAAGGMLEYTIWVDNLGPSTAENVVVEDWGISPFLDIFEVECEKDSEDPGDGCSCNTSALGELGDENRSLVCYLGTIHWGDEDRVTIRAWIPSDVPEGTRLVNDAKVYGDVFDDYNGNNLDSNWTYVGRWADLEVEKTQYPEIALPTQDIVYTLKVTNHGLSDAEGVIISDTIPTQVLESTWTCCASDDGLCDVPCEPPTCPEEPCPWPDIGLYAQADIPAGEWVIYTIEGKLGFWPCGPFTNTVEVIAPQSSMYPETDVDPCDDNNTAEAVNDPFCQYEPIVLKDYPGPDSPP
jgi:uncharacterized repeat protein (TIGR01451 family)